jgi:cell division protein FtsL
MRAKHSGDRLAEKLKNDYRYRGLGAVSSFGQNDGRQVKGRKLFRFFRSDENIHEIKVDRKRISPGFLLILSFCTVMIMMVILSFSQIYQTARDISKLEKQAEVLQETIEELELKLDEKNDIRLVEQMATAGLGMVKEDSLQRKYISLSDGERIDLIEADEDGAEQGGSAMLSSIFAVFGDWLEYFK